MRNSGTLKGIGLFQLEILHLISMEKTETFETIEKHIVEGDLVEYLLNTYQCNLLGLMKAKINNYKALNQYFVSYNGCVQGNERRKYGIVNEKDGLLLILALISDRIELAAGAWTIDLPENFD